VLGRKRLDNPAFSDRAVAALANDAVEFATQSDEIGNLPVNLREVLARNCVDRTA
jgi:hypothetical protein